ncbi:hypothetical protein HMPREF0072_0641, partial [Anaerococcus lactolyticus ATCC 51172]
RDPGLRQPHPLPHAAGRGLRATVYDGARWGELYDLARDPHETRNLWDDPAHAGVRARLMERLAYGMLEHIDTSPYPTALA